MLWLTVGLLATGLGMAGAVLPLLPATPFLLVAAFAFSRSSDTLHDWLLGHRHLGRLVLDWNEHRAIGRTAKTLALLVMAATFALGVAAGIGSVLLLVQAFVLATVATFIVTRAEPPDAPD